MGRGEEKLTSTETIESYKRKLYSTLLYSTLHSTPLHCTKTNRKKSCVIMQIKRSWFLEGSTYVEVKDEVEIEIEIEVEKRASE